MESLEKLIQEAQRYQDYAEIECSNDPEEVCERIATLNVYLARTGFMLAEAKKILNNAKSKQIADVIVKIAKESRLSATVQNALVASICEQEQYLVDWLERLNRAITHQASNCVSILSYEKEHLRVTKSGY